MEQVTLIEQEQKVQEKKPQKKSKKEEPKNTLEVFAREELGVEIDPEFLRQAEEKVKVKLFGGSEVSLAEYKQLIVAKIFEYRQLGIAWKVTKMIQEQEKGKAVSKPELLYLLKEIAEKELKYGLVPIQHTIPLNGKVYVTIDGRKYYARQVGAQYSIQYEVLKDGSEDNVWRIKAIVILSDGTKFEGIGKASPSDVYNKKWIEEMAYKRATAHALDSAFPLGTSFEDAPMDRDMMLAEAEEKPALLVSDLKELAAAKNDPSPGNRAGFLKGGITCGSL